MVWKKPWEPASRVYDKGKHVVLCVCVTAPKKTSPNGNQCYTCNGQSCDGTIKCQGDEDHCISTESNSLKLFCIPPVRPRQAHNSCSHEYCFCSLRSSWRRKDEFEGLCLQDGVRAAWQSSDQAVFGRSLQVLSGEPLQWRAAQQHQRRPAAALHAPPAPGHVLLRDDSFSPPLTNAHDPTAPSSLTCWSSLEL